MSDTPTWPTDEDVEKALRAAADYLREDGNEPPLTDVEWNADKAECPEEFAQSASAMRAALSAVNPYEWMPIDDEARNGNRYPICWKAEGGLSAHVEFGKYGPNKTWLNTYGHAFSIEPDLYFLVPSPEGDK